jgi:hypothetical protein
LTPIFKATCQSGRLSFDNREAFARYILTLKDGPVEVIVRRARVQRSDNQNKYYWACVIPLISEWSGYEHEEVHDALKQRFLTEHHEGGLDRVRSTSTLSTSEFTEYVERCRRFAAEHGVYVPDPGEVTA